MDEWDEVVMIEQRIYAQAHSDGREEVGSEMDEAKREGFVTGFVKGCALGFELGFYSEVVRDAKDNEEKMKSRPLKLLLDLEQKLGGFPQGNAEAFDFDQEIDTLRALYRGGGSRLGDFPPKPSQSEGNAPESSW